MILGFVVILYPARYVSQPNIVKSDSIEVQNDMEEQFLNETNDLLAAASNITEVEEIENGEISSAETHHYRERLKDIQDEGVEGKIKYIHFTILKLPLDKSYSFLLLCIVIITAMVTVVTTVFLVLGARKVNHGFHTYDLTEQIIRIIRILENIINSSHLISEQKCVFCSLVGGKCHRHCDCCWNRCDSSSFGNIKLGYRNCNRTAYLYSLVIVYLDILEII